MWNSKEQNHIISYWNILWRKQREPAWSTSFVCIPSHSHEYIIQIPLAVNIRCRAVLKRLLSGGRMEAEMCLCFLWKAIDHRYQTVTRTCQPACGVIKGGPAGFIVVYDRRRNNSPCHYQPLQQKAVKRGRLQNTRTIVSAADKTLKLNCQSETIFQ